jgi:pimeloyl-ACP methyl ester carboxylesterase
MNRTYFCPSSPVNEASYFPVECRAASRREHDLEVSPGVTVRVVEKWADGEPAADRGPAGGGGPRSGNGPPVLLVHGLGVGGGYWDLPAAGYSTMDHLAARGLDVYALDHRGYGPSTPVAGSSVRAETAAGDVAAVIDFIRSRSGGRAVCLVGHSWGAIVASMTAAARHDAVDSVVLMGMPYRRLHPQFRERIDVMRAVETSADGWLPNLTHLGLDERLFAHDPAVLAAYQRMVEVDYPRIPVGILDDCLELPHVDSVAHLTSPVLVVFGTLETVVDRGDMLDLIDDLPAGDKELVLVGNVGHLAALEKRTHVRLDHLVAEWALAHRCEDDARRD